MVSINSNFSANADSEKNKENDSTSLQESVYKDSMAHTTQFKCNIQFAETVERAEQKYTEAITNIVCKACYSVRTKFTKCLYVLYEGLCRYWLHIWLLASPLLHLWLAIAVYSYTSNDIAFMCNLEKVKLWVNIINFSYVFSVIFTQLTTGGKLDIKEGLSFSSLLLNLGTFICFITFRLTTDNIETPTQYASNYTCLNGEMQRLNTDD